MFSILIRAVCLSILSIQSMQHTQSSTIDKLQYELTFKQKAYMIPHPEKVNTGGEDAYWASKEVLTVADGVGGWNQYGINPANYSKYLCKQAEEIYRLNASYYAQNPKQIIQQAHQSNQFQGSSTMFISTLHKQSLKSCYIGDCGVLVIRTENKPMIIYESSQQQHSFNFPYQLSRNKLQGDSASDAICVDVKVKAGDIIVMGSDGLFDNIFTKQILNRVHKAIQEDTLLTSFPQELAEQAITIGNNTQLLTPFAYHAQQLKLQYTGGKLDDTTVIIAQIVAQEHV